MSRLRTFLVVVTLWSAVGCTKETKNFRRGHDSGSSEGEGSQQQQDDSTGKSDSKENPEAEAAALKLTDGAVIWQRYEAFRGSLNQALNLKKEELCKELDQYDCVDQVFLTVLGGNNPIENGHYVPLAKPSSLTPVAVERVVLSACGRRADLDAVAKEPVVFRHFPLQGDSKPNEPQLAKQAAELYQRFLARDPTKGEVSVMNQLLKMDLNARDVAVMSCMLVGTSSEFLFL